jgi:hypothetical protein
MVLVVTQIKTNYKIIRSDRTVVQTRPFYAHKKINIVTESLIDTYS